MALTKDDKVILARLVKEQIAAGNDAKAAVGNITRIFDYKPATVRKYYQAFAGKESRSGRLNTFKDGGIWVGDSLLQSFLGPFEGKHITITVEAED